MTDLSLTEIALIERQEKRLRKAVRSNEIKYKYYYGKLAVKDLGVSTPPRLRGLNEVLGWGAAAVDLMAERIFFRGFYSPETDSSVENLNSLYRSNFLEAMQRPLTRDALITGTSYISTLPGNLDKGQPEALIRAESPNQMIGDYDWNSLALDNAVKLIKTPEGYDGILFHEDAIVEFKFSKSSGRFYAEDRQEHELGFVPVTRVINQFDSMYPNGRTEISRPLRAHIDSGMRTLLGVETTREFWATPLRALMGADKADFVDKDGNALNAWSLISGGMMNVPFNARDEQMPQLQQMPASDPGTIMNLIEKYAVLAAREIGVSPDYFGFNSVNPASADAINQAERKLVNRANERIPAQKLAWKQAFKFTSLILDGRLPDDWNSIEPVFMRPETHTPAASADRITKMIAAGVFKEALPDFVYRELGFDEVEILQLKNYIQANASNNAIQALLTGNPASVIGG